MRRTRRFVFAVLALPALLAATVQPLLAQEGPVPAADAAARALDALLDEAWQHLLAESPTLRTQEGLPVERLPSFTHAEVLENAQWGRGMLERLATIDPELFDARGDHERWLSHRILDWQLRQGVEGADHFWLQFQVTPYTWSFSGVGQTLAQVPLATPEDRERFLRLLGQLPEIAGTLVANLGTQRERGILVPRPEIDLVVATFAPLAGQAAEHPYRVAPARLAGVPAEEAAAFAARVDRTLDERVAPAFGRVVATFDDAYRAAAPSAVGLGQYPGGEAAYRFLVESHTSLDTTPEEIHRRGLAEVERIEAEMAEIRTLLGTDLPAPAFHRELRTDPRFLACDPAGVALRLERAVEKIEPRVGELFSTLPEAPYGVARLAPSLEPGMTFGYYQYPTPGEPRGLYYFNGSHLDERTLVGAAALVYHELVPGHHFQVALQRENAALPPIRRVAFPTAFVEGWAEYASGLAGEVGLYAEPYDRYGRLAMEMFLATRLVVDTGMNHLGWSRERALSFMSERLLESETQLATETLRYAVDLPGQALGYKTGAMAIADLRRRAEEALGERFDVRRFHAAVLGSGAMPLAVLERHVEWWIGEERARRKD